MADYYVTVDWDATYRTTVEADSLEHAMHLASEEAYRDSWSCKSTYSFDKVYSVEQDGVVVYEDGMPAVGQWRDYEE